MREQLENLKDRSLSVLKEVGQTADKWMEISALKLKIRKKEQIRARVCQRLGQLTLDLHLCGAEIDSDEEIIALCDKLVRMDRQIKEDKDWLEERTRVD